MYVQTAGFPSEPGVLVFTGKWPNLELVSVPAPAGTLSGSPVVNFRAETGTTYYLALVGHTNVTAGSVILRLRPAPANDDFQNAALLSGTNVSASASVLGTTIEVGEPLFSTNAIGTLWWKWAPGRTGRYILHASKPYESVNLVVYQGDSITNLVRLGAATHSDIWEGSRVDLELTDCTFYIAIEALTVYPYGEAVHLSVRSAPPNDNFADRLVLLSETNVFTSATFNGATREFGEPGNTDPSLWWEWTAPHRGSFSIETSNSSIPTAVEVFTGDALTNLTLATPQLTGYGKSRASIRAEADATYIIRGSSSYTHTGDFILRIRPGPVNDDFANAIHLQGTSITTNINLAGSTFEPGEASIYSLGGTVWWTFVPLADGCYSIACGK